MAGALVDEFPPMLGEQGEQAGFRSIGIQAAQVLAMMPQDFQQQGGIARIALGAGWGKAAR